MEMGKSIINKSYMSRIKLVKAEEDCRTRNYTPQMLLLTILMMLDHALTWLGIHVYGIITERNPFMQWLFDMTYLQSLFCRSLLVLLLVGLCIYIYNEGYKRYNLFINICILSNVLVMYMHIEWIKYVKYL